MRTSSRGLMLATLTLCAMLGEPAWALSGAAVQARMQSDVRAGRPLVAHVIVALCDNRYQGIVPVPAQLGNGQDARTNLYWGALYGVRSYLTREAGWELVATPESALPPILETVVLKRSVHAAGSAAADVYLVCEAWDGREIRQALQRFIQMAAGRLTDSVSVATRDGTIQLAAGSAAHLIAYVGHNGLMDFTLPVVPTKEAAITSARSAIVLACESRPFFAERLRRANAHPLLLTTGLMAPEAYTLDAVIQEWVAGGSAANAREAAARAYHRYQKCGLRAARNLFYTHP